MKKIGNKTKGNKQGPVSRCEALCGAVRDPAGSQPLRGILDGSGPVLRLCGGRKKKQEKEPALLLRQFAHNCPQCGQLRDFEKAFFCT